MSHTHFLYHVVFATKDRMALIRPEWEAELYAYLSGIVRNCGGLSLEINGMPDHVHLLIRMAADIKFSDFMRELKAGSSRFVRQQFDPKFSWQRRYGAFTVSESVANKVRKYIREQKQHHLGKTFEDEYKWLLVKHGVEFDERYLWS
ncbi:MAG: IS200/IS605 family transposase [Pyrinomonadaceae bacterium]|nr:IS200/IS605 family transposase [Pyrinomonadaceae bacterium]